jgi:hypothetical protein
MTRAAIQGSTIGSQPATQLARDELTLWLTLDDLAAAGARD